MSEDTTATETATTPELPSYVTAFILMKDEAGTWRATTDLSSPFQSTRPASTSEVRQGCLEIADAIHQHAIVTAVLGSLSQKSEEDSQRVSASVRDALSKRQAE